MNADNINIDKVDDELQDNWLSDNLKLTQLEPSQDFTQNVVEQVVVKPNPLSGSPLFWILAAVPVVFLIWLLLYFLSSVGYGSHIMNFLPKLVSEISLYTISKYVMMITTAGLFFIGLDYFLGKRLLHGSSFFSFMFI